MEFSGFEAHAIAATEIKVIHGPTAATIIRPIIPPRIETKTKMSTQVTSTPMAFANLFDAAAKTSAKSVKITGKCQIPATLIPSNKFGPPAATQGEAILARARRTAVFG